MLKEEAHPVDFEIKHKIEDDININSKPGEEEQIVLKNKNIQELQNALKPRVSFSDDLPLSSKLHKSGRSNKDSPKLLRKDDIKKVSSKFHKTEESPKGSPKLLKKFVNLTTCLSHSQNKVDHIEEIVPKSSPPLSAVKETKLVTESPKVQKSILKDKSNKSTTNVIPKTQDDIENEIHKISKPNVKTPIISNSNENNISNTIASPLSKASPKLSNISSKSKPVSDIPESKNIQDCITDKIDINPKEAEKCEKVEKKGQSGILNEKPCVTFSSSIEDAKSINNPATKSLKVKESKLKTTPLKATDIKEPTIALEDKVKNTDLKNSLLKVSSQLTERVSTNKVSSKDDIVLPAIVSSNIKKTEPINKQLDVAKNLEHVESKIVKHPKPIQTPEEIVNPPVAVSKTEVTIKDFKAEANMIEPIAVSKTKVAVSNTIKVSEAEINAPIEEYKEKPTAKEANIANKSGPTIKDHNPVSKDVAKEKEPVLESPFKVKENKQTSFHKTPASNTESVNKTSDQNKNENISKTYHKLDVEALRLADNILLTHSHDVELNTEKFVEEDCKKLQLQMRPFTKHHLEEQHSLDHEAIKVSNNIFSDNTKLSEKELKSNNDRIPSKQKNKDSQESSKQSPVVHQAQQCFVVNKAVIQDRKQSTKIDLKTKPSKPEEKQDTAKDTSKAHMASSVIFTKATKDTDSKIDTTKKSNTASSVIFTKSTKESEPIKTPITKSPIESSKTVGKPPIVIETPGLERRRRLHEQDHRQKVPSSLGFSRFELTDFDVSHPVTRNATHSDIPSSRSRTLNSISQSSSFAFDSKPITTPQTHRKFQDRNFNIAPTPYSSKNNVHFSENNDTGMNKEKANQNSSSYQKPATSRSVTTSPNRYASYGDTTGISTSSYTTASSSRAKSEGNNRFGGTLGEASKSSTNVELMKKIQASKDMYKASYDKAMNFDRISSTKPVVYIPKLPRPGNDYDKYLETAERDKYLRRMERDKSVMDKVLTTRGARSPSTHK